MTAYPASINLLFYVQVEKKPSSIFHKKIP